MELMDVAIRSYLDGRIFHFPGRNDEIRPEQHQKKIVDAAGKETNSSEKMPDLSTHHSRKSGHENIARHKGEHGHKINKLGCHNLHHFHSVQNLPNIPFDDLKGYLMSYLV